MRVLSNGRVDEFSSIRCFKQVFETINGKVMRMTLYTDNVEEATGVVIPSFGRSIIIGGVSTGIVKQILEKALTNGEVDLDAFKLTLITKKKEVREGVAYIVYEDMTSEGEKVPFFYKAKNCCFDSPFFNNECCGGSDEDDDFEDEW